MTVTRPGAGARGVYFGAGLVFVLLALLLFAITLLADAGRDRRANGSFFSSSLPFFPVMIGYGVAGLALGMRADAIRAPWLPRRTLALTYTVGVLSYGFAGTWLLWQQNFVPWTTNWELTLLFVAGAAVILVLLVQVVAEAMESSGTSRAESSAGKERLPMTSIRVYTVGGFAVVAWMVTAMWRNGFGLWNGIPSHFGWLYLGIVAHAFGVTLGGVAVMLGTVQSHVAWSEPLKRLTGAAYLLGTVLFTLGLFHIGSDDRGWTLPTIATVGFILLGSSAVMNLAGLMRRPGAG